MIMQYLFYFFEISFILKIHVLYFFLQGGHKMEIGYNKLNITPTQPVHIAGYNRKEVL